MSGRGSHVFVDWSSQTLHLPEQNEKGTPKLDKREKITQWSFAFSVLFGLAWTFPDGLLAGAQDSGINWPFSLSCNCFSKGSGARSLYIQDSVACVYFYKLLVIYCWLGPTISIRMQKGKCERPFTSDPFLTHSHPPLSYPRRQQLRNPWVASLAIGKFLFLIDVFEPTLKNCSSCFGGFCVCAYVCVYVCVHARACWGKGGRTVTVNRVHTCPLVK